MYLCWFVGLCRRVYSIAWICVFVVICWCLFTLGYDDSSGFPRKNPSRRCASRKHGGSVKRHGEELAGANGREREKERLRVAIESLHTREQWTELTQVFDHHILVDLNFDFWGGYIVYLKAPPRYSHVWYVSGDVWLLAMGFVTKIEESDVLVCSGALRQI